MSLTRLPKEAFKGFQKWAYQGYQKNFQIPSKNELIKALQTKAFNGLKKWASQGYLKKPSKAFKTEPTKAI